MEKFEIIIPTLFGLESFTSREVKRLGYEISSVEDGRVSFWGDYEAVCRANIGIRTGERVLIKAAEFKAMTFDELFEGTKSVDWERWLLKDSSFPVKGYSLKSQLSSVRDCQAIIKKAIADKLSQTYGLEWLPEDGSVYQIQFALFKDRVTLMIDTSGEGLHKRGYRKNSNAAPLKETIAAAMVMMSHWKFEYPLCDPFCGSGTIPIEAAMFKRNIAPGISRSFAAEKFPQINESVWENARNEAKSLIRNTPLSIYTSDIDINSVKTACENAKIAGVDDAVKPIQSDVLNLSSKKSYGTIICNPPYGERLGDIKSCEDLYSKMGKIFRNLDKWSYYIIAPNENFETIFGQKSSKKRKIYNGMIKCNIFQYFGERPPLPSKN